MDVSCCCICESPITEEFWACASCEEEWQLPKDYADWPEWVKAMRNDEYRRRYRRDHDIQEIPVSDLPDGARQEIEKLFYGEANDDRLP